MPTNHHCNHSMISLPYHSPLGMLSFPPHITLHAQAPGLFRPARPSRHALHVACAAGRRRPLLRRRRKLSAKQRKRRKYQDIPQRLLGVKPTDAEFEGRLMAGRLGVQRQAKGSREGWTGTYCSSAAGGQAHRRKV